MFEEPAELARADGARWARAAVALVCHGEEFVDGPVGELPIDEVVARPRG
jgi:hypothetical protein